MNGTWVNLACLVYDEWDMGKLGKVWFMMNGTWVSWASLVYDERDRSKLGRFGLR